MRISRTCTLSLAQLFIVLVAAAGTASPARAQGSPSGAWQFEVTPYLWMTGLKGDSQVGSGPVAHIDLSFSDILDKLDFGLMGSFEAHNGRWGLFFDAQYVKLSDSAGGSVSLRGGPGIVVNADGTLKQWLIAAAVEYRAIEGDTPVDLFFGARYNKIDIDATVSAAFFGPLNITRSPTYTKSWWDPYIGVRIMHPIAARWTLIGYADVGGFGAGSDQTWQLMAGAKYDFTKSVSGSFGYRYMRTDYDRDGFKYDVDVSGLYLGLGFRF